MNHEALFFSLREEILHSDVEKSPALIKKLWQNEHDAGGILEKAKPISLFAFSHRYPTVHVPKEHEYHYRLLEFTSEEKHIDFLSRFIEFLAWFPKLVNGHVCSYTSGAEPVNDPKQMYISALENHKGLPALFYAVEMAKQNGLREGRS